MVRQPIVYVVDDNAASAASLAALMSAIGHKTSLYSSAEQFLEDASTEMTGCLILDVRLPGISGPELCQQLQNRRIRLPTILISGHADSMDQCLTEDTGLLAFLEKPYSGEQIIEAVSDAMSHVD